MKRALILLAAIPVPLLAHHSVRAVYDMDRPVTIRGVCTSLELLNPHALFYVDAAGEDGTITKWKLEAGSVMSLFGRGWTRESLKAGDRITVVAYPAKDGSKRGSATKVITADGKELDATDNWGRIQVVDGKIVMGGKEDSK